MNYVDFIKSLKINNDISPVIKVIGEDTFLIDKAVEKVKQLYNLNNSDFDFQQFDAENFNMQTVLQSCNQMPFLSTRKVVVIKELDKLIDADKQLLMQYINQPNPTTILLLLSSNSEKFDFFKSFVVNCDRLSSNLIKSYIINELNKNGQKITEDALSTLINRTNFYMNKISNETIKLCSIANNGQIIDKNMVEQNIEEDLEYKVFDLTENISRSNSTRSISILNNMLEKKEDPQMIMGLIMSHFRRMFYVSVSDKNDIDLANELKVKEYAIKKCREQSKLIGVKKLNRVKSFICDIDYKIKNGEMPTDFAFYYLIFGIIFNN